MYCTSSDATSNTLRVEMTAESDGAQYRCFITDANGDMGSTRCATVKLEVRDWTMEYEAGGLRTKRSSAEKTYNYIYSGDKLVRMTCGDNILDFTYDANGAPLTLVTGGKVYYYLTNLQGDVISVESSDGTPVASYCYDAWGKILSSSGDLAELNPLRYRGYVYDQETGFYYVESRYYDPAIRRFINADSVLSTGQGVTGHNAYVYCGNNPVVRADIGGNIWHIVAGSAVGAAFSIFTKVATNYISKDKLTTGLVTAGIAGAASGGLAASGVGIVGQVVGNAAISVANDATNQVLSGKTSLDWGSMLLSGMTGAGAGFAGGSGAGSKNLTRIGTTNLKRTWNALTHNGIGAAASTLSRGLTYFVKNANYIRKPLLVALAKSSAAVIGSTFFQKLSVMERRLGLASR